MSSGGQVAGAEPASILVVDDEPGFAEVLRTALSGRFAVLATTSPTEALELSADGAVKVLLTDLLMDEMDGIRLVREVTKRRPDIKCVLFSAVLTRELWREAVNAGCRSVVTKPLPLRDLIEICAGSLAEVAGGGAPKGRDPRSSGRWTAGLGRALCEFLDRLASGRSPLLLHSPGGSLPHEVLRMLRPDLLAWSLDTAGADGSLAPVHLDLARAGLKEQACAVPQLASRRSGPWVLSSCEDPESMFESGRLLESLYMRIGTSVVVVPAPSECPDDTLQLCAWRLDELRRGLALGRGAAAWLRSQLGHLQWASVFAILEEAARSARGLEVVEEEVRRASLSITLGAEIDGLETYPEFLLRFTRDMRVAWDMLGKGRSA